MDLELQGSRAVITGAGSRIGTAVSQRLAAEGVQLLLVDDLLETLEATAATVAPAGEPHPTLVEIDVTEDHAPASVAEAARSAMGGVDILVNASQAAFTAPTDDDAPWASALLVEFQAVRRMTRALLPELTRSGVGRVINLTRSAEPDATSPGHSAAAATKVWAKGLSREVGALGVTVNCVVTGLLEAEAGSEPTRVPIGRLGVPEDVAPLVAMLASPGSAYLTGEVLYVDGGLRRHA